MDSRILNGTDSSGMYSKTGRMTVSRYSILQHGEAIINDQRRFFRISSVPPLSKHEEEPIAKPPQQESLQAFLAKQVTKKKKKKEKNPLRKRPDPRFQPMTREVSREQRDVVFGAKSIVSSVNYNPHYEAVERKEPVLVDYFHSDDRYKKAPIKALASSTTGEADGSVIPEENSSMLLGNVIEKPPKRILGYVDFKLNTVRKPLARSSSCSSLDMKRDPYVSIYNTRLPKLDLSKLTGRIDNVLNSASAHCPPYNVNYEFVKRRLDNVGQTFDKVTGRKLLASKSNAIHETFFDFEEHNQKTNSQIFPKKTAPIFNKMPAKDPNPSSSFPAYLQNVYSRTSVGIMNEKSLEMNGYKTSRFQSHRSSFNNGSLTKLDNSSIDF